MKHFQILILLLFIPLIVNANDIKISKIIDSNRFEAVDGSIYLLAHIEAPSIFDTSSIKSYWGRYIKSNLEAMLLDESFTLIVDSVIADTIEWVHVIQKYPLNQINYNEIILKKGLGYYSSAGDSLFMEKYGEASEYALREKIGIWNIDKTTFNKSLSQLSLKFGLGVPFSLGLKNRDYFSYAVYLSYTKNIHHYLVRYIGNLPNLFEGEYPYGEGIFLRNTELSLMYGRAFWRKDFNSLTHITFATGISYLNIVRRGDYINYETYKTDQSSKIGLPLNIELGFYSTSNSMAVGLDLFANINSYDSYFGLLLTIGFHL